MEDLLKTEDRVRFAKVGKQNVGKRKRRENFLFIFVQFDLFSIIFDIYTKLDSVFMWSGIQVLFYVTIVYKCDGVWHGTVYVLTHFLMGFFG